MITNLGQFKNTISTQLIDTTKIKNEDIKQELIKELENELTDWIDQSKNSETQKYYKKAQNIILQFINGNSNTLTLASLHLNNLPPIFNKKYQILFENLTTLNLQNNTITNVFSYDFSGLNQLTTLNVMNNNITDIFSYDLKTLNQLKTLDVSQNKITGTITKTFLSNFLYITKINFSYNKIENIEDNAFQTCGQLKILELSYNDITLLTQYTFIGLNSLIHLKLDNNKIKIISNNILEPLTKLTQLILSNNQINTIEDNAFIKLIKLTEVDLGYNRLDKISTLFKDQKDLKKLKLGVNNLTNFDPIILQETSKLNLLDLSSNKLNEVPDFSKINLKKLEELYLNKNNLSEFDTIKLKKTTDLKILNASSNKLNEIPDFSKIDLKKLEILYLTDNNFIELKNNTINNLCSLEKLSLANNNIITIQRFSLIDLKKLKFLHLSNNKIIELENIFMDIDIFKIIDLKNNPLERIHPNIFNTYDNKSHTLDIYNDYKSMKIMMPNNVDVFKLQINYILQYSNDKDKINNLQNINVLNNEDFWKFFYNIVNLIDLKLEKFNNRYADIARIIINMTQDENCKLQSMNIILACLNNCQDAIVLAFLRIIMIINLNNKLQEHGINDSFLLNIFFHTKYQDAFDYVLSLVNTKISEMNKSKEEGVELQLATLNNPPIAAHLLLPKYNLMLYFDYVIKSFYQDESEEKTKKNFQESQQNIAKLFLEYFNGQNTHHIIQIMSENEEIRKKYLKEIEDINNKYPIEEKYDDNNELVNLKEICIIHKNREKEFQEFIKDEVMKANNENKRIKKE